MMIATLNFTRCRKLLTSYVLQFVSAIFPYTFSHCQEQGLFQLPQDTRSQPLSTGESLSRLEIEPGYSVSLMAAEPLIIDPIDVAFDDMGRMWVVEMRDYPFQIGDMPEGRITILSDSNGDGIYDHSQVFADRLKMPTGLALWRSGAVVTLAGEMTFFEDLDNDLHADKQTIWLTGFSQQNEQLRANHPRLGPDGKWYIASGLRGGDLQVASFQNNNPPDAAIKIGSRDICFDPQTNELELITGPGQFGLTFDSLGRRYVCSNRNPAIQVVFEQADLRSNPLDGLISSVTDVLPAGEASQVFPLTAAWTTSNLHAGQFTAACGVFVSPNETLSHEDPSSLGELFACEPTGNLVKRTQLQLDGYTCVPTTRPWEKSHDWLASRDPWFRAVNVAQAPDGQVVIVDMHRAVIEHPQWVPTELKQRPDERWGNNAGRIYWAGPSTSQGELANVLKQIRSHPLRGRTDLELAQLMGHANSWLRTTAGRLILERNIADNLSTRDVVEHLSQIAIDPSVSLLARCNAVQLLNVVADDENSLWDSLLHQDTPELLTACVMRSLRQINRQAVLQHLAPKIFDIAQSALKPAAQFEALLTLGKLDAESSKQLLAINPNWESQLLNSSPELLIHSDPVMFMALAVALRHTPELILKHWLIELSTQSESHAVVASAAHVRNIAMALSSASANSTEVISILKTIEAILRSPNHSSATLAALSSLVVLAPKFPNQTNDVWPSVVTIVQSSDEAPLRQAAANALAMSPRDQDLSLIESLAMADDQTADLRTSLFTAWHRLDKDKCDDHLLTLIGNSPIPVHATAIRLLATSPQGIEKLLTAMESGQVNAKQVGITDLRNLVTRAQGESKRRLENQIDQMVNTNRNAVLEKYRECLSLATNKPNGREVFRTHCAACHRIDNIGTQVGPDISDSRTLQPIQILTSILDPNLAIDNNYLRFVVLLDSDEVVDGVIAEESDDNLIFVGSAGQRTMVARNRVQGMRATGVSLMPEGLEAQIDLQQMADLIAFIKGWRYMEVTSP
ncbi:MAG: c-type cytochrome [Planctomycetales bacterium]|nr:c-type cytochrome [Planctomycetales bacterium]